MLGSTYQTSQHPIPEGSENLTYRAFYPHDSRPYLNVSNVIVRSGPKKCIHSLLINIFGINLNEISVSG